MVEKKAAIILSSFCQVPRRYAMRNCGEKSSRRAESWIHVNGMAARQGRRCVAWVFAQGHSHLKKANFVPLLLNLRAKRPPPLLECLSCGVAKSAGHETEEKSTTTHPTQYTQNMKVTISEAPTHKVHISHTRVLYRKENPDAKCSRTVTDYW